MKNMKDFDGIELKIKIVLPRKNEMGCPSLKFSIKNKSIKKEHVMSDEFFDGIMLCHARLTEIGMVKLGIEKVIYEFFEDFENKE